MGASQTPVGIRCPWGSCRDADTVSGHLCRAWEDSVFTGSQMIKLVPVNGAYLVFSHFHQWNHWWCHSNLYLLKSSFPVREFRLHKTLSVSGDTGDGYNSWTAAGTTWVWVLDAAKAPYKAQDSSSQQRMPSPKTFIMPMLRNPAVQVVFCSFLTSKIAHWNCPKKSRKPLRKGKEHVLFSLE